MKQFLNEDFLLSNHTAKILYHDYAEKMPIIDYHCHISPEEIAEDKRFENITQAWLYGDHYKWRLIRANGVEESSITGKESSDWEKFLKFAEVLPKTIGNPMYHWTHLELKRYFGCEQTLSAQTAESVWKQCNEKLRDASLSVRGIIRRSNVKVVATTDDPVSDLRWHEKIAADPSFEGTVVPSFRPDKALGVEKPGFGVYLSELSAASGVEIRSMDTLCQALEQRLDYFGRMGCRASDHALDYVFCRTDGTVSPDAVLRKALAGESLSTEETETYKTALLLFLGRQYAKRGWAMQLHYGTLRNNNTRAYRSLGPDTGYDCIGTPGCAQGIVRFLDELEKTGELPKTILYSCNPNDNAVLDSITGSFQGPEIPGKIQHGCAWWFNDTKLGMENQLSSMASISVLGNFIGMVTDSRSFLSYTRHEYFRRILCNLIGTWVENGEYPNDLAELGKLVQDISYNNAAAYFHYFDQAK